MSYPGILLHLVKAINNLLIAFESGNVLYYKLYHIFNLILFNLGETCLRIYQVPMLMANTCNIQCMKHFSLYQGWSVGLWKKSCGHAALI